MARLVGSETITIGSTRLIGSGTTIDGKKTRAEEIIYTILDKISKEKKMDAIKFFHDVLNNVKPRVEVRSRRVGGATYQVPMEVKIDRSQALAIRWIIDAARKRGGSIIKPFFIGKNYEQE